MSLMPRLFSEWWEDLDRPHKIFDQNFGLDLDPEELFDYFVSSTDASVVYRPNVAPPRRRFRRPFRPRRGRGAGAAGAGGAPPRSQTDRNNFRVSLDVQQFAPNEINVKVVDKFVVVEANHEEKKDEHGWISRKFVRRYRVPDQFDLEQVESHLSSDGVLTIIAPRKPPALPKNERPVQIKFTGQPAINDVPADVQPAEEREETQEIPVESQEKEENVKAT